MYKLNNEDKKNTISFYPKTPFQLIFDTKYLGNTLKNFVKPIFYLKKCKQNPKSKINSK